jgi:hypothetical protein
MTIFKQNGGYCFRVISATYFPVSDIFRYFSLLVIYFDIFYTFQGVFKEFVKTFLFSRAFQVPLKMNFKFKFKE